MNNVLIGQIAPVIPFPVPTKNIGGTKVAETVVEKTPEKRYVAKKGPIVDQILGWDSQKGPPTVFVAGW